MPNDDVATAVAAVAGALAAPRFDGADSPFHELLGLSLVGWRENHARRACDTGPRHVNRSGIVHGGVVLSLLNEAGAFAGCGASCRAMCGRR
jgi:acyl-coenzyme A thioesterase PaaI-like protein